MKIEELLIVLLGFITIILCYTKDIYSRKQ